MPVLACFPLKCRLREVTIAVNRESSEFFSSTCRQQPLGAATSVKRMWLQRSPTLLSIGPPASPKPNLRKLTERLFSCTHSRRRPLSNGHLGLFKTQLTVSVRSEVISLGVKLKVAILSIHSWKFVFTASFVREVIAYECTHVWASEKKRYL
jgi:hypothetical protein